MRRYGGSEVDQIKVLDDCYHLTSTSKTLCSEKHIIIYNKYKNQLYYTIFISFFLLLNFLLDEKREKDWLDINLKIKAL